MVYQKKASSSFLKKRTKKLLPVASGTTSKSARAALRAMDKSFLVLFFKKELLACLLLLLAQPAAAEPAIWMLQGPSATIYLFGTMHILPHPVNWLVGRVATAFDRSTALWEEADIGMAQPQIIAHIMSQAVSPEIDLWHLLPPPYADKFARQVQSCHMPANVVAHFRPWFAAMLPTVCDAIAAGGNVAASSGPEGTLLARAKAAGKQIFFFETAEQQIGYLSNQPQNVQVALLKQAIDESGATGDLVAMESSWSTGDVAAMARIVAATRHDNADFYRTIFVERNERFAARIAASLHGDKTIFIAIGAGHLVGPDSVPALLARQGFVAKRL